MGLLSTGAVLLLLCPYLDLQAVNVFTSKIASATLLEPLSFMLCLPVGKFIAWMSGTIACWAFLLPLFFLATWFTYDVMCGSPTLPRRKLAASFSNSIPPTFMMS